MREAMVILPATIQTAKMANGGWLRPAFEREVYRLFGGFTLTHGNGGWADHNGKWIEEPVHCYTIAMTDNAANASLLRELACDYARKLDQQSVYVRFASGEVEIIDLVETAAANAA